MDGRIGYVQQNPAAALNPARRVGGVLDEFARAARLSPRHAVPAALRTAALPLDREQLRRYPHQFSGGQQQRLVLAEALVGATAQLFRVYVRPRHRRHGLARRLVGMACDFIAATPGYQDIYLHTDTRVPGAEAFWRSIAKPVHDTEDGHTIHFQIPVPALATGPITNGPLAYPQRPPTRQC